MVYDGVHNMVSNMVGYSELDTDVKGGYQSEPFSNLPYQDLYNAHTISVIPIGEEDFIEYDYRKSVDSYKKYSDNVVLEIQQNQDHHDSYFLEQSKREEEDGTKLAFRLAKEAEESSKKNRIFWGKLMTLK
jgi:hypothetical protein